MSFDVNINIQINIVSDLSFFHCHRHLPKNKLYLPKNDKLETICLAIVDMLKREVLLSNKCRMVHEPIYGNTDNIPSSEDIDLLKLSGGVVD